MSRVSATIRSTLILPDTQSSRLGTGSDTTWCQRQCCRPRSPALSGFLLGLSTSRSALGGTSAGDPLLAVITPHHVEAWVGL